MCALIEMVKGIKDVDDDDNVIAMEGPNVTMNVTMQCMYEMCRQLWQSRRFENIETTC